MITLFNKLFVKTLAQRCVQLALLESYIYSFFDMWTAGPVTAGLVTMCLDFSEFC